MLRNAMLIACLTTSTSGLTEKKWDTNLRRTRCGVLLSTPMGISAFTAGSPLLPLHIGTPHTQTYQIYVTFITTVATTEFAPR